MANNRIFYAVQALKIGSTWVKGVQSVGITTNFNLEQVFEMGQLGIYENIQNIPEVEVTAEKVIDGATLLYTAAGATAGQDIVGATSGQVDVRLAIYKDTGTSASGATAEYAVLCTGMRVSAISYTFPVEGNATESITLVGNSKTWDTTGGADFPPITGTLQTPVNNVFRRQHFNNSVASDIPSHIGTNKIQSITASADIGRENIFELGSFAPYTKYATFPVTTTCDIEVISITGDQVVADQTTPVYSAGDETIELRFNNGTKTLLIDLGSKNRLTSVNYSGADTGGGNATSTYSYQGFNYFQVSLT
jgi:hypothetical protein